MASQNTLDDYSLELLIQAAKSFTWDDSHDVSDQIHAFLTQIHSALDPTSLDLFRLDDIASMARDFWEWSRIRREPALIRVRNATGRNGQTLGYSVLEACGPDMPFIVRSLTGACLDLNINPVLVMHPILSVTRDADGRRGPSGDPVQESCIQIYMDLLDETVADALIAEARDTLTDIAMCVADYPAMRTRMQHAAIDVLGNRFVDEALRREASQFLNWLADEHFTFLGSREYIFPVTSEKALAKEEPVTVEGTNLGILRDEARFILKRGHEPSIITAQISEFLQEPEPVIVAKGSMTSRVHRRVRVDYIGVKRYDDRGEVVGEIRFAGLFTADAYNRMTRDVPMLREKVNRVVRRAGKLPGSHDESALKHILENYPRDELFQISEDEIFGVALSILQLQTRNETRLFVRKDRFSRFISALVFVPKESFNSDLRARIANVLCEAYNGTLAAFYPLYGDAPLARIHYLIDLEPEHFDPDAHRLEELISKVARSWNDQMRGLIRARRSKRLPNLTEGVLTNAFTAAYKEAFAPEEGLTDVEYLSRLSASRRVLLRAFRNPQDDSGTIRAKIYSFREPVELSSCVPVFENMGLFVVSETGYPVKIGDSGEDFWVHDVRMRGRNGLTFVFDDIKSVFEEAFEAVWTDRSVSDGFNRLVLSNAMSWRQAGLFRTFCRYRRQTGLDPGQALQIQALVSHQDITRCLLEIFNVRFDPDLDLTREARAERAEDLRRTIASLLDKVESLDEDRILRRLDELLASVKRTNFFQINEHGAPHDHIAIKIASREIEALPNPKPYREIFVWAPHVEGVHLRFGPVARGGLRWSDRQDDFRTEVLGLVKAQQVKNAVIVPVGSKGGFFPKRLPKTGDRDAVQAEGIRAYRTFIRALLQLTDNLVDGEARHPKRTLIWEEADPYLVVAADKGTATFSDIANEISTGLGFWLGDAFASGGSAGYDHKKMGITARGAWVAVQRHFREMGINVQTDPIDVIGVGDMSGDVFGNGMLLSESIRLKAAFNHLHIFIDPDPKNPQANWAERKRLFDLPRSSWADYSTGLLSSGGGIFPRSAKSIDLSPEIQAFLKTDESRLTPNQLIQAILKAQADLLWFGGIGTYVKAKEESHTDVGDKANDAVRVNAADLNVKVVGEGANLGVTQSGRIAFARRGGRINSDAIDNSAGVDSSDHEVNIKILLKNAISSGDLMEEDRNALLASMTDEVAQLVLVHNYDQTSALSIAEASSVADLDSHERLMERLEAAGILNREVEVLPKPEEVRGLKEQKQGLTRPELAVLLAYAKITLFDEIVATDIPDEAYLETEAFEYFPAPVRSYRSAVTSHRLKREIIATRISNDIVNLGGITFVHRVRERAGVETAPVIRAFVAADEIFGLRDLLRQIDGLDYRIPASTQTRLRLDLINAMRRQVFWIAKSKTDTTTLHEIISEYRTGVRALLEAAHTTLSPYEQSLLQANVNEYIELGATEDIAIAVANVCALTSATDIVEAAERQKIAPDKMALMFSAIGDRFRFDRLKNHALSLQADQHWDRLATRGLVETLLDQQETLAERLAERLNETDLTSLDDVLKETDSYISQNHTGFERLMSLISEIEKAGSWSFAKLVLVTNALRGFIEETNSRTQ